ATLGPKVLASRMVRDYVERLYAPATGAGRALNGPKFVGARDLAAWKSEVRTAWPAVKVDHVESSGISDSPQVGDVLHLRAFVNLDGLEPQDVVVQVVHGRVSEADEIGPDSTLVELEHAEAYEGGRHRFEGDLRLTRTGSFGYTARILP